MRHRQNFHKTPRSLNTEGEGGGGGGTKLEFSKANIFIHLKILFKKTKAPKTEKNFLMCVATEDILEHIGAHWGQQ